MWVHVYWSTWTVNIISSVEEQSWTDDEVKLANLSSERPRKWIGSRASGLDYSLKLSCLLSSCLKSPPTTRFCVFPRKCCCRNMSLKNTVRWNEWKCCVTLSVASLSVSSLKLLCILTPTPTGQTRSRRQQSSGALRSRTLRTVCSLAAAVALPSTNTTCLPW